MKRTHYRTIFISDLYLGFRGANTKALAAFLKSIECDTLYLVGDVFDLWAMAIKGRISWEPDCNAVLRRILKMMKHGTKVVYIIGNHDDAIRHFVPVTLGSDVIITNEHIHTTAAGKKFLVIHGDQFDFVAKWLSMVGSWLYDWLIVFNGFVHNIRMALGFKRYWSFSAMVKKRTKRALSAVKDFETAVLLYAQSQGCDGAICGHIHTDKLYEKDGITYANCGDWVESLTALVEHSDGRLEILHWHDMTAKGIEDLTTQVA